MNAKAGLRTLSTVEQSLRSLFAIQTTFFTGKDALSIERIMHQTCITLCGQIFYSCLKRSNLVKNNHLTFKSALHKNIASTIFRTKIAPSSKCFPIFCLSVPDFDSS